MSSRPDKDPNVIVGTAVYQAMNDNLLPSKAAYAVALWSDKYKSKKLTRLEGFLDEVTQVLELDQQCKQKLRKALYQRVLENKTDLQTQPNSVEHNSTMVASITRNNENSVAVKRVTDQIENQATNSPAFTVFSAVGSRLIEHARKKGQPGFEDFTAALNDYLKQSSLQAKAMEQVMDWCSQPKLWPSGALSEKHYGEVIHLLYMALCEALGPVAADALLNDGISQAQLLPEAEIYSPKRLL